MKILKPNHIILKLALILKESTPKTVLVYRDILSGNQDDQTKSERYYNLLKINLK